MESIEDQIKRCDRKGCNPEIEQFYCCGLEFKVVCNCGKQSLSAEDKNEAIEYWNSGNVSEEK